MTIRARSGLAPAAPAAPFKFDPIQQRNHQAAAAAVQRIAQQRAQQRLNECVEALRAQGVI